MLLYIKKISIKMINIRSEYDVDLRFEEVHSLSKEEMFNVAFKEFNVYIEHYPNECLIKTVKNHNYNSDVVNKYLNQGIYSFYKMMFDENLIPNQKIKLSNEIYHYIQINDLIFFESIKDQLEIYKFNNRKMLDKLNVSQELFAMKNIKLSITKDNNLSIEKIFSEGGVITEADFIYLSSYINSI